MKTILIVKTSAIGDVIQTFPVVDYLRKVYPGAQIDWVVERASVSLLEAHPDLNRVLPLDTKYWRRRLFSLSTIRSLYQALKNLRATQYDLIVDVQGNCKSGLVTLLARGTVKLGFDYRGVREKGNLLSTNRRLPVSAQSSSRARYLELVQRYCGVEVPVDSDASVRLRLTPSEQARLEHLLHEPLLTRRPRLLICFGSYWKNKQLNKTTLITLLDKVAQAYDPCFLFVFGNAREEEEARELAALFASRSYALGNMSLSLWQAVMWEMDLVFAVDSAALHLCATTTTPSLSVFGPSQAHAYKPPGARHQHVQGACPYGRTFTSRCPVLRSCPTGACLRDLDADVLFHAMRKSLKG